jgi:cell division protein FtsW
MSATTLSEEGIWGDRFIVIAALLLAALGLLSVFASTGIQSGIGGLRGQAQGLVLAVIFCLALAQVPTQLLLRFAVLLSVCALVLFCLTLFTDLGVIKNGARRSMRLGPTFLMPAEVAKPALVLLAAKIFTEWGAWNRFQRFAHGGLVASVLLLMLVTKDLGTPLVIVFTLGVMWFLSGAKLRSIFTLLGLGFLAVVALIKVAPHRMRYVTAWLDPFCESVPSEGMRACLDASAALRASFMAIADGGLSGLPLGAGQGPMHLLEGHNDFIGAVVAEQFGLLGFAMLAMLFVVIIGRSLRLAHLAAAPDLALVAVGCGVVIGLQGLIHLAVVSGTIPPKGLTLPLVSVGTSSLVATGILVGMLLSIGREQARAQR